MARRSRRALPHHQEGGTSIQAICSLLEIPAGVVALTKTDLVESDLVELARLEVEELLEGTPFAGAAVVPVSSATGEGVPALEERLLSLAAEHARAAEADPTLVLPARLPIDRAFHLKGLGVVVTGTLAAGRIAVGDTLEVLPPPPGGAAPARARVRSVQVHGESRSQALAAERSALQLAGAELGDLARGRQAVAPGRYEATRRLLVHLRLLPDAPEPLRGPTPVRLHLLSSEVLGRVRPVPPAGAGGAAILEPGQAGPVEIRLREPVVAVRGDRVILRRPSPETTLGGGVVLDPSPRSRRARDLAGGARALAFTGAPGDPAGASGEPDLDAALRQWAREAGPAGLAAEKILVVDGDLVNLPGRTAELTGEESALSKAVLERFAAAGLTPSSPAEVGRELGAKPQILEGVVRYLVERGRLLRLPGGLILAASAIDDLRGQLEATGWDRFTVPQFKDRFGLTRKWAIPILEHLDGIGATRRLGDERMIVKR